MGRSPASADRRRRVLFLALVASSAATWSGSAHAVDVEVAGATVSQTYEVASPWGYEIERRRLLQTVGFSLYHLQGAYKPNKPDYNIRVMFRVDADFGVGSHLPDDISAAETDYGVAAGNRFVPGLASVPFDLMTAYVEGKNLADGWLSFRAGRQYVTDVLGWWSFDGGLLRVHTPGYVDFEMYGGFEQRGGLLLSTSRYEPQGVWRGSHQGFDEANGPLSAQYPSFQQAGVAPAFGGAIETSGPNWIKARLSYRRVYNTAEAFTQQFPDPSGGGYPSVEGMRLSSERLGFAANINKNDVGGAKGGLTYDFYNQLFATAFGGLETYLGDKVTIGVDADHYNPTFDADSIFNWFTHSPTTTGTGRVEARITKEIDISAQGGVRVWSTEGDPETFGDTQCSAAGLEAGCARVDPIGLSSPEAYAAARAEENRSLDYVFDGLGQLVARYRGTIGKFEARGMVQAGERGHRFGGEVSGERKLDGGRYALGARVSVFDFGDSDFTRRAEADPNTTSFGYMLGAGVKPLDVTTVTAEWEHSVNERIGQRFRVLARLDVLWGI